MVRMTARSCRLLCVLKKHPCLILPILGSCGKTAVCNAPFPSQSWHGKWSIVVHTWMMIQHGTLPEPSPWLRARPIKRLVTCNPTAAAQETHIQPCVGPQRGEVAWPGVTWPLSWTWRASRPRALFFPPLQHSKFPFQSEANAYNSNKKSAILRPFPGGRGALPQHWNNDQFLGTSLPRAERALCLGCL